MTIAVTDFEYVRDLVRKHAAIVLEANKGYLVESRLEPLARRMEGIGTLPALVTRMRATNFGSLHEQVIDAMTTNETSFFRDIHPFELLKKELLPQLIEKRKAQKTLEIWCAACSSGQEPYTLAMLIREHFPQLRDWKVGIRATDLSPAMLARAKEGKYSQLEVNRGLPAPLLAKYFTRQGASWVINDEVRSLIDFRSLNLIEPWPSMPAMDIVFIRNVLIYFDVEVKKKIFASMRKVLRPDGFLFLGAAETTLGLDDAFARMQYDKAGCFRLKA